MSKVVVTPERPAQDEVRPADARLRRLAEYVGQFRAAFRRRDQLRWAGVYLQGLLLGGKRSNAEGLAARVVLPPELTVEDVAQALQNFVNQSPWDEEGVWRRYRALLAPRLAGPDGVFVVEDVTFPKQGQRSVGVHRQFSRSAGRKINCQIAVALSYVSAAGDCPLALRLYLPRVWVADPARLDAAGVPPPHRRGADRGRIALDLLDAVRAEGWSGRAVVAWGGQGASREFRDGLEARGLTAVEGEAAAGLAVAIERQCHTLKEGLGLDHFEGRSWRGFHHHACLVMLAYGLRVWERDSDVGYQI
jgi:SRSO17 transposase